VDIDRTVQEWEARAKLSDQTVMNNVDGAAAVTTHFPQRPPPLTGPTRKKAISHILLSQRPALFNSLGYQNTLTFHPGGLAATGAELDAIALADQELIEGLSEKDKLIYVNSQARFQEINRHVNRQSSLPLKFQDARGHPPRNRRLPPRR
jgi:hypothetical protein